MDRFVFRSLNRRRRMPLPSSERPLAGRPAPLFFWGVALSGMVLAASFQRGAAADAAESSSVDFNRDIRPILSDHCFKCHGPDAENQDSEFRLDSFANATADLGGYAGVMPGDLKNSLMHARIHDADDPMPPADDIKQLDASERALLDRWIEQGATYDVHWSFKPLPETIETPDVRGIERSKLPEGDSVVGEDWCRDPIDAFVYRHLDEMGLPITSPKDRLAWLRRVTFDLTGLPPTIEAIDAFLADRHPDAKVRVVDRLLSSPACAERLTAEWLDVARYSDTYGYQRDDPRFVWPYRDWVIRAFQSNLPYDEFLTQQIAGDLLPDADDQTRLATVFGRLHSHKKEGGVAIEEFRVENVADRTHTVASAVLGLTMECSRCHDHKYDPITMQDYYSLSAFFDKVDENGLISYFTDAVPTPAMTLADDEQSSSLTRLRNEVSAAEAKYRRHVQTVQLDAPESVVDRSASLPMVGLTFDSVAQRPVEPPMDETGKPYSVETTEYFATRSPRGFAVSPNTNQRSSVTRRGVESFVMKLTGDDAVVIPDAGHFRRDDAFSLGIRIRANEVESRNVLVRRSRGWDDAGSVGYELTLEGGRLIAKVCHYWPGDAIAVRSVESVVAERWIHVALTYDGSSRADGLRLFVDGRLVETEVLADHLTRNVRDWRGGYSDLAIGSRYRDRGFKSGLVDDLRVDPRQWSGLEIAAIAEPQTAADAMVRVHWTAAEAPLRREHFVLNIDPEAHSLREAVRAKRRQLNDFVDSLPAITVMRPSARPRQTQILGRGVYDNPVRPVDPNSPSFLPPMDDDLPRDRLGLARWLTDTDHPLTARVAVNRYWQLMMGTGLVQTPEDFGNQGQMPTHPELLDHLARDFVASGWDLHRLLKRIALSSTYEQSSAIHDEDSDVENRSLGRAHDVRLSAEMIRDGALAAAGLLSRTVGGQPVKPYDVALAYTPSKPDEGEKLYRRSLYTFWKRTSPSPVMMTLNTPSREVCRVKREITDTPLQALVLMNGPQFVEASRALAIDVLAGSVADPGDDEAWIQNAYRRLCTIAPTAEQTGILMRLFRDQRSRFAKDPDAATALLSHGWTDADAMSTAELSPSTVAAATVVVQTIMNLDAAVRLN